MLISQQTNLYIGFFFFSLRKTERKREIENAGREGKRERENLNQALRPVLEPDAGPDRRT